MHKNEAISFIRDHPNCPLYFEKFWESVDVGIAFIGKDGSWLKCNPALCEILEYTEAELQQRTLQEVMYYYDVAIDSLMKQQILDGSIKEYKIIKRCVTKTSQMLLVKAKVIGIFDPSGQFVHYLMYVIPEIVITDTPKSSFEPDSRIRSFLRQNWQWAATTVVMAIAFFINTAANYKILRQELSATSDKADKNSEAIITINNSLQDILRKLDSINK